jgi:hypothetical protein
VRVVPELSGSIKGPGAGAGGRCCVYLGVDGLRFDFEVAYNCNCCNDARYNNGQPLQTAPPRTADRRPKTAYV